MSTLPQTFLDAEAAARSWARSETHITAQVAGRSFFGVNNEAPFPQLVLRRIGGGPLESIPPIDDADIQWDCWGGSKEQAWQLAQALIEACRSLIPRTPMGDGAIAHGARVGSVLWSPDPATDKPRYVVNTTFTLRAA